MKSRNFITLANDLNTLSLPAKQDTLIQLCNLLAQYECIRNKIFTEKDTLDPSFIVYIQTPMNIDVDAVRVLSLFLAEHREEAVKQGVYNPKTRIANIFRNMPNLSHRAAPLSSLRDVFWFQSAEEAGVIFLSIYNSDLSNKADLESDPKADATRAIYSFLPQIQSKLQYLIDTLGILHNVTDSIQKEKQIKINEIVAAESVRELRDFPFIKKMIKTHFLLHSYVKAECKFRFLQASEVLQVAAAAALSEGTINSDVVNACKNQSMKMEQIVDIVFDTEQDEKKLFYTITHNEDYIGIAETESRLLQIIHSIISKCDKAVSLCAELRLPDLKVWPYHLSYQASRCTDAIQSFINIVSQIGHVKEELKGGAAGPCTTIRNLTWLGASSSISDCKEKIISLAGDASGAGILFLTKTNQWKCVHMKEKDMLTIAPRWLGGKKDPEDLTWFDTAMRECNEETFFLAKGFGNKSELENIVLQLALSMPQRIFVAETRNKEVYGDKPPYILLIVNITNTFLEKRLIDFVSEYSIKKLPPNLPDFYLEQGCFQFILINSLPANLTIVLNPLLSRIDSYSNYSSKKSIQTKSVFHSVIKKNKHYSQIPTLFGGMALSSIVPLLLDQTVPIGLIDAQAEFHAQSMAMGSSIGYITAGGQRHLIGGSNPSIWYEQIAEDDIYIPIL